MAGIFDGINFESPLDAQQRLRNELFLKMREQPNEPARFGTALGAVLRGAVNRFRTGERGQGLFHRLRTGDANPQITEARENQAILSRANADIQSAIEGGADPLQAQATSLMRAAQEFAARGRGNIAAQLQAQASSLMAQIEVRQAELNKLRAETDFTEARTDQIRNPAPETPKDELTRMQNERDRLTALLKQQDFSGPAAATIAKRIDETNQRIEKIITITGRTETDAEAMGLTKPTINKLQDSLMANQAQLDLINEAMAGFDPQFYTLAGRFKGTALKFKAILGSDLTPDEKEYLIERVQNVQALSQQLNAYIKAVTGAQMAVAEAARLSQDVPMPGEDPVSLQAKLDRWALRLPAIIARAQAALAADDITIINTPLEQWYPRQEAPAEPTDDELIQKYLTPQ